MEMVRGGEWSSNSAATSSTPPSSSASSSSSFSSSAAGLDRIELEAAEALADLAHLAMREGGGGSPSKWGSKGKRAKKRVKSESPPPHSAFNTVLHSSVQDLPPLDQPAVEDFQHQPVCETSAMTPVKPEKDADLHRKRCGAPSSPPFGGGRSRQVLSEAEKEARRLRRILANRESARQTIRRRQALCEELTRKAASLALENENLKREKELVLKEQEYLEATNKQLKSQMAKAIKAEVVEQAGAELKQTWFQMPTHHQATNCQMLFHNQPAFAPLCWPPIIQSQETQESHTNPNTRTSLYLMSCPWFLPVADNTTSAQHHPQPPHDSKHFRNVVATVDDQCSGSSSIPQRMESEAAEVVVIDDLNEMPVGDRGGEYDGQQDEVIFTPSVAPSSIGGVKSEIGLQSCSGASDHGANLQASQACDHHLPFRFSSQKLVDAAAATVARRRRKELTRLKNIHGRQCRMNC